LASSLERLVTHDARLGILGCLDGDRLTIPQVSGRVGKAERAVGYHLRLLAGRDVVEKMGDGDDALYAATLDKHPVWVAEAVREHRRAD
jgi:DNA-binding transcriptional ArsR family regulator